MTEKEPKPADLTLEAGISATGASAKVSATLEVLRFLMPGRRATEMMLGDLAGRLQRGEVTEADAQLLDRVASKEHARWVREQQIGTRAAEVLALPPATLAREPPPPPELPPLRTPSEEWLAKFWDDAGLVSEPMMQEVYAQILTGEARAPGSVSLRTLRTLRYLDQSTAELFQKAVSLALDEVHLVGRGELLAKYGLPLDALVELEDAGLISTTPVFMTQGGSVLHLSYGRWVLRLSRRDGYRVSVYMFKNAGRELGRVATNVTRSKDYFLDVARHYRSEVGCEAHWAERDEKGAFPAGDPWQELHG